MGSNELKHDAATGMLEATLDDVDLRRFLDTNNNFAHLRQAHQSRGLLSEGYISIPYELGNLHHLIPVDVEMERDGLALERVTMYLSPPRNSDFNQRGRAEIEQIHSKLATFIAGQTISARLGAEHREDRYPI